MTIFELGAIGEFVGAIAVVLTLGYLAVQIRQSNRTGRASAANQLHTSFQNLLTCFLHDDDLSTTLRRGFWEWDTLPPNERHKLHCYWSSLVGHAHHAGELMRQGLVDEDWYTDWEDNTVSAIATPGLTQWWSEARSAYPGWFRERIEARLADRETMPPLFYERFSFWQRDN